MNYTALIQNRKSVRSFTEKEVPASLKAELKTYFHHNVQRLIPSLKTDLVLFGKEAREALEGAAGYHHFLVGSPQYLVLLTEEAPLMYENAGYIMEDLILKLTDLNIDSCWLTFTDSNKVKKALGLETDLHVAALAAFGYGVKAPKRLKLNILSMSNVDISAKRHYFEPKRGILDLVFLDTWGNSRNVESRIGFYDDMLWEALYAASLSPSYLNRQAYGFLLHDGEISLISRPDDFTTDIDGRLSLGVVLQHFTAAATEWAGSIHWRFGSDAAELPLPEGHRVIATCSL